MWQSKGRHFRFQFRLQISGVRLGEKSKSRVSISDYRFQTCIREKSEIGGFDFRFQISGCRRGEKLKARVCISISGFNFRGAVLERLSQS